LEKRKKQGGFTTATGTAFTFTALLGSLFCAIETSGSMGCENLEERSTRDHPHYSLLCWKKSIEIKLGQSFVLLSFATLLHFN
jgi:hypothetical protein